MHAAARRVADRYATTDYRASVVTDRADAGSALGRRLGEESWHRPVVLGLARGGGVPVAARVAEAMHARIDVMVFRKIGLPGQP